jgi:hypothetical protein
MQRLYSYLAIIPIIALAVFPPIELHMPLSDNKAWLWLFLISGCLGIYTLFTKINILVKLTAVYIFISCFFSAAPYLSFALYIPIVAWIYFYILCTKIRDWQPVRNALIVILSLNTLLSIMQAIGRDSLLNFGLSNPTCSGVVGNHMQQKSLLIIANAALLGLIRPKKRYVVLTGAALFLLLGYAAKHNVISHFLYARGAVWLDTLKLCIAHPFVGWGPGMFKMIFPTIGKGGYVAEGMWYTAHNCWLQMLFETGAIGFSLVAGYFIVLFKQTWEIDRYLFLGLIIIALDMMVHFPTRQIQTVPIMLMFLARCEQKIRESRLCQPLPK